MCALERISDRTPTRLIEVPYEGPSVCLLNGAALSFISPRKNIAHALSLSLQHVLNKIRVLFEWNIVKMMNTYIVCDPSCHIARSKRGTL